MFTAMAITLLLGIIHQMTVVTVLILNVLLIMLLLRYGMLQDIFPAQPTL
jgi:hypothetical protein